jgi:amino acid adenylation domain-containing protein
MGDLSHNLSALSAPERRVLLERILRQKAEEESVFPLSYGQRALWFLQQLAPNSAAYNMVGAARIRGAVDTGALQRAFQALVERHACLRTTFNMRSGQLVQKVHGNAGSHLVLEDASGWSDGDVDKRLVLEHHRPFDLAQGLLLRATLFTRSAQEHVLLLGMHHIIGDFWSLALTVSELQALYAAEQAGAVNPLPPLPARYREYVRWQERELTGARGDVLRAFWENELAGQLPVLDLPTDRPRPAIQTYAGSTQPVSLSPALVGRLKRVASAQSATLYMALLAAYQTLLYRYTGQEEIIIGSPTAGRSRSEFEGIIGYFVNPVALRLNLSGGLSFNSLLGRMRRKVLDVLEHQDYPFPLLVERLQGQRDSSRSPIFQAVFAMEKGHLANQKGLAAFFLGDAAAKLDLNGLPMEFIKVDHRVARFDFNLELGEGPDGGVTGTLQYNTDLFDPSTASRIASHYRSLIESIVADPDQSLSRLPILTEAEKRASFAAAKDSAVDYGPAETFIQVFEERAAQSPMATAARCGAQSITYGELNRQANRLARALSAEGIGRESLVALLADRGIGFLTAVLAVFKVGAAYLPLNPTRAASWRAQIEPSGCAYVLVEENFLGMTHGAIPQEKVRCLNRLLAREQNEQNLPLLPMRQSLAYVIYTSGRKPTGVMIEQAGMLNHLHGKIKDLGIQPADIVAQNASQYLDVSVWQFLAPLMVGAAVEIIPDSAANDPMQLFQHVEQAGITVLEIVASFWKPILDVFRITPPATFQLRTLRWLISTGGALTAGSCRQWFESFPGIPVIGTYGATETSDDALHCRIVERPKEDSEIMPLGTPLGNIRIHLLDEFLEPVPNGAPGDIYIGGVGVGRGYLGRPELTAGRFIPDPFAGTPGERLYKTGNRARYRGDDTLHIIGAAGQTSSPMPAAKTDRRSQSGQAPEAQEKAKAAGPRTPVEEVVTGIWAECLAIDQVDTQANFFDLGGHSLLATQMISRMRETFHLEVPLRSLFEHPTAAGFAKVIEDAMERERGSKAPPLVPVSRDLELPMSFAQQRLWLMAQLDPATAAYNAPAALRLTGDLSVDAFSRTLSEIYRRHESLRTTFTSIEGRPVQRITPASPMVLDILDLSHLPQQAREEEAMRLAYEEARRPFDLAEGPVVRARLLRLDEKEHIVLFTMHHIVSDGWSVTVLKREVAVLYEAFSKNQPSPLPELTIQYADFAYWQRKWLDGEVLEEQLGYWRRQLKAAPALLELPTDRPRPALQKFVGATQSVRYPSDLLEKLRAASRKEGVTLYMFLLAAFNVLLSRYSGQQDIVVGSPIANRTRAELEGLIGFFVNTLAIRTDLSGDPAFRDLLGRVRETVLGAYAHQDLPFAKLVETLRPERATSHTPIIQVMLVLQNTPPHTLNLSGVQVTAVPLDSGITKFDLTLYIEEWKDGLAIDAQYDSNLFDPATISRVLEQFRVLLEGVVADPVHRISAFSLSTDREGQQQIGDFNSVFQ